MANEKQEPPRKVISRLDGAPEPWLEASLKEVEAVTEELWAMLYPQKDTPAQECPPKAPRKRSKGKKKAKDR
jgi:hypothetical protein